MRIETCKIVPFLIVGFLPLVMLSQNNSTFRDSINRYTQEDYAHLKQTLGIEVQNRPGPSGDPNAPNAANFDEANVKPYTLPSLLISKAGKPINSVKDWETLRRPELVAAFEEEMYGALPEKIPAVSWSVVAVKDTVIGGVPITEERLRGVVDNSQYPKLKVELEVLLGIPQMQDEAALPVVMHFGSLHPFFGSTAEPSSYFISPYEPLFKQQLAHKGWAYAVIDVNSIQADNGAGLNSGIIGLVNKGKSRSPGQWGSLRAWGWGASKLIDYFETRSDIDAERTAIEGTSRYGKAALVAMAFDTRISLGFIGSSGAGGASLLRRNYGEMLENLASTAEYHWFAGNFIKYASIQTVEDLPVDAHQLIALCAPRPVFISAGSSRIEGNWVDVRGMFDAAVAAQPVYELYGLKGLGTETFPVMGTALTSGALAFRQHGGGHSTGPNWSTWIAWASRYWNASEN